MNRLGVFGGTFDPPHQAHLVLAELTREQLGLQQVLWVVAGAPPHKTEWSLSPVDIRVEMVRRAIKGNAGFALSRIDVDRPGPHYTADMLTQVAADYPDTSLFLLIGADSLRDFLSWHEPRRIIEQAHLAVVGRRNVSYNLLSLENALPGLSKASVFVDSPEIEISASQIRQRVADGQTIRYLVPREVETLIFDKGLYGSAHQQR